MLYINYYDWLANCQIGNCNDDLEKEISGFCNEAGQTKSSQIKNEQHLVELNEAFSLSDSLSLCLSLPLSVSLFLFPIRTRFERKERRERQNDRSSCSQMLFQVDTFKNVAIFTGEHLCWGLFFNKYAGLMQICSPMKTSKNF